MHEHVWHGDRPSKVRCAVQDCHAKPSKADLERVRIDAEARRRLRIEILYRH